MKSIDISVLCEKSDEDAVRRVMQQWQRILGISVNFTVKAVEKAELERSVSAGNFQIALYNYSAPSDSIYEFFGSFTKNSPYNFTGFTGQGMEELLGKLYSGDESNFRSVYSSVESKLSSASLVIPVGIENSYFVCKCAALAEVWKGNAKDVKDVIWFSGKDKLYFHKATNES